jgi:hypothetical protein
MDKNLAGFSLLKIPAVMSMSEVSGYFAVSMCYEILKVRELTLKRAGHFQSSK